MTPATDGPTVLESPSGASLATRHWSPDEAPRAIVHINHGLAEHAARYDRFAKRLTAQGFAVFAHDHRGHGDTRAPDAPHGVFSLDGDGPALVMADCAAVQDHARALYPDCPLIMFGHSMGGLITMNYALAHADRLAGAAVWNANFSGGLAGRAAQLLLKWERFRLGSDVPSRLMPKLTFQTWAKAIRPWRTDYDWLSHIEEEVDAYIADPDCGWDASVSMWLDVFDMIYGGAAVSQASGAAKALPVMLVGGGEDPATDMAKATRDQAQRLTAAGFSKVYCHIFETARHETLNDLKRDEATGLLIEWCNNIAV